MRSLVSLQPPPWATERAPHMRTELRSLIGAISERVINILLVYIVLSFEKKKNSRQGDNCIKCIICLSSQEAVIDDDGDDNLSFLFNNHYKGVVIKVLFLENPITDLV